MNRLAQNFDLLAIVVLAFVLGVAQAPLQRARIMGLEQSGQHFRIMNAKQFRTMAGKQIRTIHVNTVERLNSICR